VQAEVNPYRQSVARFDFKVTDKGVLCADYIPIRGGKEIKK
jgi:hypothetical protein